MKSYELQTIDSNPKVSAFMVWDPAPTMLQHGYTYEYMCKETTVWMGSLQLYIGMLQFPNCQTPNPRHSSWPNTTEPPVATFLK